jgi:hypothetical protein
MAETAFDALEHQYPALIAAMPEEFDSHSFILRLAQANQRLYIEALAAYASSDHPFQIVHGMIANRLHKFTELVAKAGERSSVDIFGQSSSAVIWRKVSG